MNQDHNTPVPFRAKDFDKSLAQMFELGGQRKKRAEKVSGILANMDLNGVGVLKNVRQTKHKEDRIPNGVKYDLGDGYRLITAQTNKTIAFLYVGSHDESERWLTRNSGLTVGYNKNDKILKPIFKSEAGKGQYITRPPMPSTEFLSDRLPKNYQQELLAGLPALIVVEIGKLGGAVSTSEIQTLCKQIEDDERRGVVHDVLTLLASDDRAGAETRLDEFAGRFVTADDRPLSEIVTVKDGDTVRRLPIGSEEYEIWLQGFSTEGDYLEWLLFMHPEQERFVEEDFSGPAQLSGVSGSGKTCIAVRRAIRLATQSDDAKVLLVTLNRSLSGLIQSLIDAAVSSPAISSRINVTSFFELCQDLLNNFEPDRKKYYDSVTWKLEEHIDEVFREYYRCWTNWEKACVLQPIHASLTSQGINAEIYLKEEFDWLRSALSNENRSEYSSAEKVPRSGRQHPLQESSRLLILEGLKAWEEKMESVGAIDYLGLTTAVSRYLEDIDPIYTNVIIDEAQDFGTTELQILRKLVSDRENDIFLCGDIAQHVLPKHRSLTQAGINLGNRARSITQNYRNSRQILESAFHILDQNLHEEMFPPGADGHELLDPEYAHRSSNSPLVLRASELREEIAYARTVVSTHLKLNPKAKCCIGIAGFSMSEVVAYASSLGLTVLDGSYAPFSNSLVLSDLEQTKGYEFDLMVIVNCREGVLPPSDAPPEEVYRDGCRLYVAMTRAKNDLYISYSGTPSKWLQNAESKLTFADWKDVEELDASFIKDPPERMREIENEASKDELELDGVQFCYTKRALGLSLDAQEKLRELVDGKGKRTSGRGRIKWRTVNAAIADINRDPRARRLFGPVTSAEIRNLTDV